MRDIRKLQLRREAMTDLGTDDLRSVAAADAASGLAACAYVTEIIRRSALPTCWCTPTCA